MPPESAFEEFEASGLAADSLPGNSAKLRLALDLAALARERHLRVLDVGCAGPEPLNLWEPFLPLRNRIELVGVDVDGLDRAEARARQLGLDVVATTQVLEHLSEWRGALREFARVLRPGGTLLLTCDSGDVRTTRGKQARLAGKRAYAAARRRVPALAKAGDAFVSGEWERGLRRDELAEGLRGAGVDVERLDWYSLHCVKVAQRHAGAETRLLWLSLEETLARESAEHVDPSLYAIIYARCLRP